MANSTENFSGYNLDRNSSKVMAPPGGKSSISFGGYDGSPQKQKPPAKPAASAGFGSPHKPAGQRVDKTDIFERDHQVSACQANRNKSSVFNGPATPPAKNTSRRPPGGASTITFG